MEIRFSDFIGNIRYNIANIFEYILNNSADDEEIDKNILKLFQKLKRDNYDCYTQLLGLFVSDHYKLLYSEKQMDILSEDDEAFLDIYSDLYDIDDIINLIDEEEEFILDVFDGMIEYNTLGYFEKRDILNQCKPIISQLCKLSPLNSYEYLYHTQKYTLGILKMTYEEFLEDGITKDEAIDSLIDTIDEIYYTASDYKEEYFELISNILVSYYAVAKHELASNKKLVREDSLKGTVGFLESSDAIEIIKKTLDFNYKNRNKNQLLTEVLGRYIDFNEEDINYNSDDETYNKTMKKLKDIKEF